MITKEQILLTYIQQYDDYDLRILEAKKLAIKEEEDLLQWLETAISHNYYTGHYWSDLYDYNNELSDIVEYMDFSEEYVNYLAYYADCKGDIFILGGDYEVTEKIKYAANDYVGILSSDEFDNIQHYSEIASYHYINEIYSIPEYLTSYIDYEKIYRELNYEPYITVLSDESIIIDDNRS